MARLASAVEYAWRVLARDVPNLLRHGRDAPLWAERIWVDPARIEQVVLGIPYRRSAEVATGWDAHREHISDRPKMRAARAHWRDGVPWEETGVYDYLLGAIATDGESDGLRTLDDVVARYRRLDATFERVAAERRLLTRRQLSGRLTFRELGGIRIHIGPDGEPLFAGSGQHRLVMAQVLELPTIPAQVGVVHPDALPTWRERYRAPDSGDTEGTPGRGIGGPTAVPAN